MKRVLPLIALCALILPCTAFAMQQTTWDLRGSTLPSGIHPQSLTTVEPTADGLLIDTQTDGFIQFPPLTGPVDVFHLTAINAQQTEVAIIWRTPDLPAGQYYQRNVVVPVGEHQEASIPLNLTDGWSWNAEVIALAFPAGSKMVVEEMDWRTYSTGEKLWNGWVSFWQTDHFRLYSINFLWGPLLGTTPEARLDLYETLPPHAWSATRIFYGVLIAATIVGGVLWWMMPQGGRKRFLAIVGITGALLWVLFDVRMTQEVLSYVRDDWRSYVLRPAGSRTLRTHMNLYDILDRVKTLLGSDARYVLIVQNPSPFFSNARYALLPATPVRDDESTEGVKAWIVLGRTDITVKDGNLVQADGTVLARGGTMVERLDEDSSFFYRIP